MEALHLCCVLVDLNSPTEHNAQLCLGINWMITEVKFKMNGEYWPRCKINWAISEATSTHSLPLIPEKRHKYFLKHFYFEICVLLSYKFRRNLAIPRRWLRNRDNWGEKLGLFSAPLQSDEWIRRGLIAFSWPLKEATHATQLHNCRPTLSVLNLCYSDKLQSTRGNFKARWETGL